MSKDSKQDIPKIDPEELRKAVSINIGKPLTEEEFKQRFGNNRPPVYRSDK
jgi:hypothetical protein